VEYPAWKDAYRESGAGDFQVGRDLLLEQPRPGWRPGKDIAGTVTRQAADGTGPRPGQRVAGHPDQDGWAERAAVPTDRLVVVPDTIDLTVAAALPLAGLTALRLLRLAGPAASRRVLVTGASGGVGHYFTELAADQGATGHRGVRHRRARRAPARPRRGRCGHRGPGQRGTVRCGHRLRRRQHDAGRLAQAHPARNLGPWTALTDLAEDIAELRQAAVAAAEPLGLGIVAAGTAPPADPDTRSS
jgi:hypothetical protein